MVVNLAGKPWDGEANVALEVAFDSGANVLEELKRAALAGKLSISFGVQGIACGGSSACGTTWWQVNNLIGAGNYLTARLMPVSAGGFTLSTSGTNTYQTACGGEDKVPIRLDFASDGSPLSEATASSVCTSVTTTSGRTETLVRTLNLRLTRPFPFSYPGTNNYYWILHGPQIKDYISAELTSTVNGQVQTQQRMTSYNDTSQLSVFLVARP